MPGYQSVIGTAPIQPRPPDRGSPAAQLHSARAAGVLSTLAQLCFHGIGRCADLLDHGLQYLGRDAELLGPVADFVILAETDAATVLRTAIVGIVCHCNSPPCSAPQFAGRGQVPDKGVMKRSQNAVMALE